MGASPAELLCQHHRMVSPSNASISVPQRRPQPRPTFWSFRAHSLQLLQDPTLKPSCKISIWLRGAKPSCEIGTPAVGPD
eukprot:10029976-Karenia_brevis.AAC.1